MTKSCKILLFLLLCFLTFIKAQNPFIRSFTTKDGLPQQQVMGYFEDSRGFLWLGTKGGLSRFDGTTFKNYNEEDGIPHNIVRNIKEDENGNIWFTTILGLVCFDGTKFTVYRNETLGEASMTVINSHKIFIYSKDWILWEDGRFISKKEYFKGLNADKIVRTYYDKPTGNMYVCYGDKEILHLYKEGKLQKIGGKNLDFINIQRLPKGEILFGRFVNGFVNYEIYSPTKEGGLKLFLKKDDKNLQLFNPIQQDIYVGHFLGKTQFYIPKGQKGSFKPLANPIPEAQFQFGAFYEIHNCDFYVNQSGRIWIDTEQGLYQVQNNPFELVNNADLNNVWTMTEDKNNNYYFATFTTGKVFKYDGKKCTNIFDAGSIRDRFIGFYFGASRDGQGNLYFPYHHGIFKYDGRTFTDLKDTIPATNDKTYCETSHYDQSRNWLLAGGYHHVKVFDLTKNTTQKITLEQGLHNSEDTEGVLNDTDNSLWIFGKQGITHWQPEKKTLKNYAVHNERGNPFGGVSGCVDSRGTVWMGNTFGLCYFDRNKDAFEWASKELKHFFTAVTNYDKDHLILGTADGLIYILDLETWYRKKTIKVWLFNNTNGYEGGKIQQNGFFKDSKGIFWLLSAAGLSKLHPERLSLTDNHPLKVYIQKIDSVNVHLNHGADTIFLPKSHDYFNAELGVILVTPSVKTFFSYRLKGSKDTAWSTWSEDKTPLFTALSSGIYTLEVKARPLGYDETAVDSIQVKVDLPFYEEPWFTKISVFLLSLSLVSIVFQLTRNWFLNQKLKKNAEAIRYLEIQTLQAQMNPHFIYNILGSLQNVIYQNDSKTAGLLLLRLSKLIRGFLETSVRSNNFKHLNTQHDITLNEEIELLKLYIEFEQFVRKDKFTYNISIAENIDADNFTLPPIIIQPYVENAIKHGIFYKEGNGHLTLNFLKKNEDTLVCEIIDDGVGVERAKAIQKTSIKSYKSLSSDLILERVKRLNQVGYNIMVQINDRPESGTIVTLTFSYSEH